MPMLRKHITRCFSTSLYRVKWGAEVSLHSVATLSLVPNAADAQTSTKTPCGLMGFWSGMTTADPRRSAVPAQCNDEDIRRCFPPPRLGPEDHLKAANPKQSHPRSPR